MGPRRAITFPMFGDGIFTQEGSAWKHSREMLRPQLQHKQYDSLEVFKEAVDDLINCVQKSDGIVDLQPLFFRLTLDITTAFLFGESARSLGTPEAIGEQTFANAFNAAQQYVTKRFRLLDLYWLLGGKRFMQACKYVHQFADQIIDRNLSPDRGGNEQSEKYVFLDTVAQKSPDRTALRGQIINILVAGRDTTACLLSWTLYVLARGTYFFTDLLDSFLLARHPQVLHKLRAEIASVCKGSSDLSRADLHKMTYLQNVLKESMSWSSNWFPTHVF